MEASLNAIDPLQSWGWDDRHRDRRGELKLRRNYLVEMFAYSYGTFLTPKLEMAQAFRLTKYGSRPKGIIKLKPVDPKS